METREQAPAEVQKELVITRKFKAPRGLVFQAWTEPERLAQWWGPKGAEIVVKKLELRPGGTFLYSMAMPGAQEIWGKFTYREIAPPERLVFVNAFSDAHGGITANPWMPNWPLEILNNLTFTEEDGTTTLTLRGGPINASELEIETFHKFRPSMEQGFKGTFEQLDAYLASHS